MNFTSVSGILLSAAAVIWVALIIPAWFKSSENRTSNRQFRKNLQRQEKAQRQVISRATNARPELSKYSDAARFRWIGVFFFAAALAGILSGAGQAIGIAASISLGIIALVFFRRASVLRNQALMSSLQNRSKRLPKQSFAKYLQDFSEVQESVNQGWKPVELPEPMHKLNRNGKLEAVTLAEVSNIESAKKVEVKNSSIDEILKRRRAI